MKNIGLNRFGYPEFEDSQGQIWWLNSEYDQYLLQKLARRRYKKFQNRPDWVDFFIEFKPKGTQNPTLPKTPRYY